MTLEKNNRAQTREKVKRIINKTRKSMRMEYR